MNDESAQKYRDSKLGLPSGSEGIMPIDSKINIGKENIATTKM